MKNFKKTLAATAALTVGLSSLSAFAMPTYEFDNGMEKGINYFNRGMYYEARDEFQWFCDANWGAMNPGQQQYALDYLGGAKANVQKWEQYLRQREQSLTRDEAIEMIRNLIGAYENSLFGYVYSCYDKDSYYLVNASVTQNADGISKYRVYKNSKRIEYIGSGSEWDADASEF